jgi:hypothetical protein
MEMRVGKTSAAEMGLENHIRQKDLMRSVDLIILLEEGSIIRVEKPDAETVP